jgi:nucleoid-associated protein YgaU
MKASGGVLAGMAVAVGLAGCRAATRIADYPRVDLEVEGAGNRGYLVGTPPAAPEMKTVRKMVHTDVEVPSTYRAKPGARPPAGDVTELTTPDESVADADGSVAVLGPMDSYVVQKGDSLWTIAARPEVYGSATQWRRLYDANRDLLKSPNQIKVGMTLNVPRSQDTERTTYSK